MLNIAHLLLITQIVTRRKAADAGAGEIVILVPYKAQLQML